MQLREYISVVEDRARRTGDLSPELTQWIDWARAKADWIDPLLHVSDIILDAPEPQHPGYW